MKSNAPHPFFDVSSFDGNRDDSFVFGAATAFTRALAANEKLIHFKAPGQFFTFMAYGATPELLEPGAGGTVAAKPYELTALIPGLRVVNHHMAFNQRVIGDFELSIMVPAVSEC